jgi:zeta-carotene desaturase
MSTSSISGSSTPIVIGGGVAGIAAAVSLARAGLRPTLIESRPYLGGRVRSFIHAGTGDEIDNGQHLLMGCYEATFSLLDLLGTRHLVELQPELTVEFREPGGTRSLLKSPLPFDRFFSSANIAAAMMRLDGLTRRERLMLMRVALDVKLARARPAETVTAYLARLGQSRAAQERLWHPIVIATLNTAPEIASAELFRTVMRRAFLGGPIASRLALPRVGLSQLFEPAVRFITGRGGQVLLGAPATTLSREGNGLRLDLKDREPIAASTMISALPSHALRSLLVRGGAAAHLPASTERITYSPIVSLYLWYDRSPESLPRFAALLGTRTQWIFNRRAITGTASERFPGLIACTISAAASEAATGGDEIVRIADAELRSVFPELRDAVLLDAQAIKEKQATFTATPEIEALRPGVRTSLEGLVLAGDWTNTGLPATIEGAAWSGFTAADEVIRSYTRQ